MLTVAMMDELVESLSRVAADNMREIGVVGAMIVGVSSAGPVLSILETAPDSLPEQRGNNILLPGPLREWQPEITEVFAQAAVQAAISMAEYWTFRAEDRAASQAAAAGSGPMPSQVPDRQEGVAVAGFWPLGGYTRMVDRQIVRAQSGPALLVPWQGTEEPVIHSWVEDCLPA